MNLQNYFQYIFTILNVSLALFFSVWQLILALCVSVNRCKIIPKELAYDSFFIISFYLVFLLATIFFFLVSAEKWIRKVKSLKVFFLTLNIIFIAFLFFEM